MSKEMTIDYILKNKLSISRYGDGEFRLMTGRGEIGFQKFDSKLSEHLKRCFKTRDNHLLICCNDFKQNRHHGTNSYNWWKNFIFHNYRFIQVLFDKDYIYGDAEITRFYHPDYFKWTNFDYLNNEYIPMLKNLWKNRNVFIVEGENTKLGIGNNLFDNVLSIKRIICPAHNAYQKYDSIYKSLVKRCSKDDLILISLGPTASVLSVELTVKEGLQCFDIGHVDVVFTWFTNRCSQIKRVSYKEVNEASGETDTISFYFDESKYREQIIEIIE